MMAQYVPLLVSRFSFPVVLLCVSCATLGRLAFTEPDVELQEIAVTGIGLTGGTFELAFDVYNPNDYRIRSTRLEVGIGMGYLRRDLAEPGTEVEVDVRGRRRPARIESKPLYHPAKRKS